MKLHGKTLAITGLGFIGLRMAELALARGMKVRGMDISADGVRRLEATGGTGIRGNVCDPQAATELCEGADIVFHTAAVVKESGSLDFFRQVNVEGTRCMAEAARQTGVTRFIHLSSVMVYGFDFPRNVTEEGPLQGCDNPYCMTKIESEEVLVPFHTPGAMEVTVIRPGDVYGPGSIPWVVRPLDLMRKGLFMLVDKGRGIMNHVYVDNLLDAVFLTLEKDATGQAFNVTDGQETTFAEYFTRLGAIIDKPELRSLPRPVVNLLGTLIDHGSALLRVEPPMSRGAIGFVTRPHAYCIQKARDELGYEPRLRLDEGMERVADWVRKP